MSVSSFTAHSHRVRERGKRRQRRRPALRMRPAPRRSPQSDIRALRQPPGRGASDTRRGLLVRRSQSRFQLVQGQGGLFRRRKGHRFVRRLRKHRRRRVQQPEGIGSEVLLVGQDGHFGEFAKIC